LELYLRGNFLVTRRGKGRNIDIIKLLLVMQKLVMSCFRKGKTVGGIGLHCLPNYKLGKGIIFKKQCFKVVLQGGLLNYNCE